MQQGSSPSDALEQVRRQLYPDLPPEEAWEQIEAAILGDSGPDSWARIERMAADDPDLFANLIRAIQEHRRVGEASLD